MAATFVPDVVKLDALCSLLGEARELGLFKDRASEALLEIHEALEEVVIDRIGAGNRDGLAEISSAWLVEAGWRRDAC